jgi:hypothetical protein
MGIEFDTETAHSARIYNYWLGGTDNFPADQQAAEQVISVRPSIRSEVRANRAFLGRAVRFLAGEAGIRQFLDIGTGLPTVDNTHEVAQAVAPECRVVYTDNDQMVLTQGRSLLQSTPQGATAYLDVDLRDTAQVLSGAAATLDFSQPVAVMLVAILHNIPDSDEPHRIVAELVAAVPSGSYLVISHPAKDIDAQAVAEVARRYNALVAAGQTRRTEQEFTAFFDGTEIVNPGVTQTPFWRPDPADGPPTAGVPMWAAVGRKP